MDTPFKLLVERLKAVTCTKNRAITADCQGWQDTAVKDTDQRADVGES